MSSGFSLCRATLLASLILLTVQAAGAETVHWAVDFSDYWDVPANWSTGTVPQPADDVVIDRGDVAVTVTHRTGHHGRPQSHLPRGLRPGRRRSTGHRNRRFRSRPDTGRRHPGRRRTVQFDGGGISNLHCGYLQHRWRDRKPQRHRQLQAGPRRTVVGEIRITGGQLAFSTARRSIPPFTPRRGAPVGLRPGRRFRSADLNQGIMTGSGVTNARGGIQLAAAGPVGLGDTPQAEQFLGCELDGTVQLQQRSRAVFSATCRGRSSTSRRKPTSSGGKPWTTPG